jgi:hypothetical protein
MPPQPETARVRIELAHPVFVASSGSWLLGKLSRLCTRRASTRSPGVA